MIGELESTQESKQLEWKVPNFSSLNYYESYKSSSFSFANHSWHLVFKKDAIFDLGEYLNVFLDCETQNSSPDVTISFSIKKSDGSLNWTKTFSSKSNTGIFSRFCIDIFKLRQDNINLLPSGILTIVCNLKCGLNLNGEEEIAPAQKTTSLNENTEAKTLEHVILAETDVLSKNFKDLFFNGECCDVVLQVQDKEFKAHRAVLIARSSVFAAMFKHDTSEKQTGIINVPDCDVDTFQQFLKYLYSGKLESVSSDAAVHLYKTSDKYDVKELKSFCTKHMMQNLTVENICQVVVLADEYDEADLLSACQKFFNECVKQIVKTSEWENLLKMNYRLANKLIIEMTESKC